MSERIPIAEDFDAIRQRLAELREEQERVKREKGEEQQPDRAAFLTQPADGRSS